MPWTVSRSDACPASRPWAVIKDDDGSIEGCHASEADAQAQLVALNIAESEGRAYESIDFKPPEGVATEAQRGLDWRREYGRGGTEIGIARARDLAGRRNISPETARRIKAYFDRHQSDKDAEGYRPGEDGYPSNGRIAAALWGGFDDGYPWARELVRRMNAEDEDRSYSMEIERRLMPFESEDELVIEPRQNGQAAIVGYAAVYNRLSLDLGGGLREEIMPGAFDRILNRQRGKADVVALFNHDSNIVLGRTSSGTLELSSDEKGLRYVVTPPASRSDIMELIARRDVRGSSFAFTVDKAGESFRTAEDGKAIRQIREIKGLYDVGPVLTPAYPASSATVAMRSYQAWLAEQEQEEPEKVAVRSVMSGVAASVASLLRLKLHG